MERGLLYRGYVLSLLTISYIVGEIAHFLLGDFVAFFPTKIYFNNKKTPY
jgi:hypothetical protein